MNRKFKFDYVVQRKNKRRPKVEVLDEEKEEGFYIPPKQWRTVKNMFRKFPYLRDKIFSILEGKSTFNDWF